MNSGYQGDISALLPTELEGMDNLLRDDLNRDPVVAQKAVPRLGWRILGSKVNQAMHKALSFNVFEILSRAWQKAPELSEFADRERYPADKPWTVYLGK